MSPFPSVPSHVKDFTGHRFGHLLVTEFADFYQAKQHRIAQWLCRCDCGRDTVVLGASLRTGATKSCGCRGRDWGADRTLKNTYAKEYRIWKAMHKRCTNPNTRYFHRYGGRGITVDPRWDQFAVFLRDMGACPGEEYSLERLDNDLSYTPVNCRWATQAQQVRNTCRNIYVTYQGETRCLKDWAQQYHLPYSTLRHRYIHQWPLEKVFSTDRFTNAGYDTGPNRVVKVPAAQRVAIYTRYTNGGITQRTLAEEYGVSQASISRILTVQRRAGDHTEDQESDEVQGPNSFAFILPPCPRCRARLG